MKKKYLKKAFVTGVTGQDGAYLSKLLIEKGYKVFGGYRRSSSLNVWRLEELGVLQSDSFTLVPFDLTDPNAAIDVVSSCSPDEIYNLAAQSFVEVSFFQPMLTANTSGLGALNLLEAIRRTNKDIKFYQASTSELYGMVQQTPQDESTPFYPRSPYGVAKLYAHWITINYRESYGLFAACGILFNHESPLRGEEFVTRKITKTLAEIKLGKSARLSVGNLNSKRDWGYAEEYVDGMWRMLQHSSPDNFVLATGRTETVREFIELSAHRLGWKIVWSGTGIEEVGYDEKSGQIIVDVDPRYFRPAEVDLLVGSAEKAKNLLNWMPKTTLNELSEKMVDADLRRLSIRKF